VHPFVHVALGEVDVSVEVDDADVTVDVTCHRPHVRIPDRVVAADHDGEDSGSLYLSLASIAVAGHTGHTRETWT
jgi:hypothetical protein